MYFWVDGVHFGARMEDASQCMLVMIGATKNGDKELLAISDGYRESEQSWLELLNDLKRRGLEKPPKLAIGDGALGFWKALGQVYGTTRWQRCWMHKSVNVWTSCQRAFNRERKTICIRYGWPRRRSKRRKRSSTLFKAMSEYPKATECLAKDREALLTFYDFPAEHWIHLRTTNPIDSTIVTVRLRTNKTRGMLTRERC